MYEADLTYNRKKYKIKIKTIFGINDGEDHYDLEIQSNKKITGQEIIALRTYLKEEGYVEQAKIFNEQLLSS